MFCRSSVWLMVGLLCTREHLSPCLHALQVQERPPLEAVSELDRIWQHGTRRDTRRHRQA